MIYFLAFLQEYFLHLNVASFFNHESMMSIFCEQSIK